MKRWLLGMLVFVLLLSPSGYALAQSPDGDWPEGTDNWSFLDIGVDYQVFHLTSPRPINIFVARMDRSDPDVTIETGIAGGSLLGGRETTSGMANRVDESISYWRQDWGSRNNVIAAINGYFFDDNPSSDTPGMPISGVVHSGWYAKRFNEGDSTGGFAWTLNRTAHIGICVDNPPLSNKVIFEGGYSPKMDGVNIKHDKEQFVLYTPQYDTSTHTIDEDNDRIIEIVVELNRPTIITGGAVVEGKILEIHDREGDSKLQFDYAVLSFWGDKRATVKSHIAAGNIQSGGTVQIVQEIEDSCDQPKFDWSKTFASLGGDYHFRTNDGTEWRYSWGNSDSVVPNSRTAVAYNANYVYLIVVDGFDAGVSEGIKVAELVDFVRYTLQAENGVTMDSGGSSTMVIDGEVANNTYCNFTRNCGMLSDQELANMGLPPLDETYKVGWDDISGILEPLVGTSMMISRVSPPFRSTTFTPQVWETTARDAEIRQGPGSNYGLLYTVPAGKQVYIEQHANNMTGILAKGHFWWKVYYGTDTPGVFYKGWMREDDIVGGYLPGDLPTPTATLAVSPTPSETPTITLTPTITPTPKPTATLTPTPEGYIRPTEFSYMPMVQSEFTSISKSGLEKIDIASPYYKLEWR